MSLWEAALLGVVQGLTEFLPISSTAHLLFVQQLLGRSPEQLKRDPFTIVVQLGTLGPGAVKGEGAFFNNKGTTEVSIRGSTSISVQGMRENANDFLKPTDRRGFFTLELVESRDLVLIGFLDLPDDGILL